MIPVDRLDFLRAVKFIKPAMSDKEDANAHNCLHIRQEQGSIIFTAGNGMLTKKYVLTRPSQLTIEERKEQKEDDEETNGKFMIPLSTLSAFETLVKEHKEKAKKLPENDQAHLCVDIGKNCLDSFGVQIDYKQPTFKFHDFEEKFNIQTSQAAGVTNAFLKSSEIDNAIKGFGGVKSIEITFLGDGEPIHFMQDDYRLEALLTQSEESSGNGEDD